MLFAKPVEGGNFFIGTIMAEKENALISKEKLLETANALVQPKPEAAQEYGSKKERLAETVTSHLKKRPDLTRLIGENNLCMMEDNHRNHARFMESVFLRYAPNILVETVIWVFRAYRAHGFKLTYWPAMLDTWVMVLEQQLSPESFEAVYPFYNWMIVHQAQFVRLSEEPVSTVWDKHGES